MEVHRFHILYIAGGAAISIIGYCTCMYVLMILPRLGTIDTSVKKSIHLKFRSGLSCWFNYFVKKCATSTFTDTPCYNILFVRNNEIDKNLYRKNRTEHTYSNPREFDLRFIEILANSKQSWDTLNPLSILIAV